MLEWRVYIHLSIYLSIHPWNYRRSSFVERVRKTREYITVEHQRFVICTYINYKLVVWMANACGVAACCVPFPGDEFRTQRDTNEQLSHSHNVGSDRRKACTSVFRRDKKGAAIAQQPMEDAMLAARVFIHCNDIKSHLHFGQTLVYRVYPQICASWIESD